MQKEIINGEWKLVVDSFGGRIVSLDCGDKNILGTFVRIDGKKGNTHVCTPNFGNEGVEEYDLPFHGPSRNEEWQIVGDEKKIEMNYEFLETEKYKGRLSIKQEFDLEDGFRQRVTVKNIGEVKVPVNVAVHNYWNCNGNWQGLKVNGVDVSQIVRNDDYFDIKDRNVILFPDGKRIDFEVKGFGSVRLWTGRDGENFDKDYVCIEPVIGGENYFGSDRSLLDVGEKRIVEQKMK